MNAATDTKNFADFKVADLVLADWGRKEIRIAETEMPGLMAIRQEFAPEQPLRGARIDLLRGIDSHRLLQDLLQTPFRRVEAGHHANVHRLPFSGSCERIGRTRRYRLTERGLKLGVLLVKLRTRLLGPLATLVAAPVPSPDTTTDSAVEAAFRQVDHAIDHLCVTLGLKPAA